MLLPHVSGLYYPHAPLVSSILTLVMLVSMVAATAALMVGLVKADYETQQPIVQSIWFPSQVYPTVYASIIASVCLLHEGLQGKPPHFQF